MEKDPNGKGQHESGAKLDDGKIQPYLMMYGFSKALKAVAEVTTYGAKKYSPNGWASVRDPIPRYSNAKVRHMLDGVTELHDPESGLLHAAHEAWNALAVLEFMLGNKNAK